VGRGLGAADLEYLAGGEVEALQVLEVGQLVGGHPAYRVARQREDHQKVTVGQGLLGHRLCIMVAR